MQPKLYKQSLIWGILLIFFGIAALVDSFIDLTAMGWTVVLLIAGLVPLGVYWQQRSNWAYLIPTYVFWSIAGLIALISWKLLIGEIIPVYVLWAIAFPFLVGFLRNRANWGLLIPAYVLFAVGAMVGLIGLGFLSDLLIPAYVMIAIALPFFVVYLRNPKNWWALIPGGIMGIIAVGFLLATPEVRYIVPAALVLLGIWILIRQFTKA
jgi:hypothetical protein